MSDVQERPWGSWQVLAEDAPSGKVVKLLTVFPGCMLSLQSHRHRAELWQPLQSGLIKYVRDPNYDTENVEVMGPDKVYHVFAGQWHRLINPTSNPISVIETIVGKYDEEDIVRHHDAYGRD